MKKLIRQYEQKNKIIEEIQKNLRLSCPKSPRITLKHKQKASNQSFQIDLPTINVRHDYTPRGLYNSINSKHIWEQPKQSIKQIIERQNKKQTKPWVQTISFRNEGQRSVKDKPLILINHRVTLRNFMRSVRKIKSSTKNGEDEQQVRKQIFLSPNKFPISEKASKQKLHSTIRYNLKEIQNYYYGSESPRASENIQIFPSQVLPSNTSKQKISKNIPQQDLSYSQKIVHKMMSTQLNSSFNKQKQYSLQSGVNPLHSTIQHTNITNHGYSSFYNPGVPNRRSKKSNNNKNKRTYSPWSSSNENQQIHNIWDSKA